MTTKPKRDPWHDSTKAERDARTQQAIEAEHQRQLAAVRAEIGEKR